MIKVLMSSTSPIKRDGITNVILNLMNNADNSEYQFDLVSINEPEPILKKAICDAHNLTIIPRSIRHPLRFINEYRKACEGYDIVHVHGNSATMFLEMFAAKLAGVKVRIAHSHNTFCNARIIDKVFRAPFYALCNGRLACGQAAGKWLFRSREFSVINNGIDSEKFRFNLDTRNRLRKELGWNDEKIIGHVGNFYEAKNHTLIIDVFSELHQHDDTYKLILIGIGPLIDSIKEKAQNLGLADSVYFAGSVENVNEYLCAIDLILMPSIYEGFPLTLVEEQANGMSCVISDDIARDVDLTGNVEFISRGLDVAEWVAFIERQFSSNIDRKEKSRKAIENIKAKEYDIKKSVKKLEDIYFKKVGELNDYRWD